jgi:Flp pilus assembly protein TadG
MNDRTKTLKTSRKGERGSVLAMTAISMFSLLLAAGLAIDISHFYTAKAELQNAVDAAALAGASQLNSTSGGIQCAVREATKSLNNYDFKNIVTITATDVSFATNLNGTYVDAATAASSPASIRFVKVTLSPKPVDATFSALVINKTQNLSATATAGLSVGLSMNKFYTAYTFIEPASTPLVEGNTYTLSAQAGTVSTPNSYRVLSGPDGDLILTGQVHAYGYIGTSYNIQNLSQSEMCRYAKVGMNTRFGDYTVHPNVNPTDEPPDQITQENITYKQYTDRQGAADFDQPNGMKNRRVFTVPIAADSTYNTTARTVTSNKLAGFFVKRKITTSCTLEVEYIGAPMAVPEGTFTPGSPTMGDLSIPVLYR